MFYKCLIFSYLASIFTIGLGIEQKMLSQSYEASLKAIKENGKLKNGEKFYVELLLKHLYNTYQRKIAEKLELERKIKQERENEIYRKYLASRLKNSSVLKDFHTSRYWEFKKKRS